MFKFNMFQFTQQFYIISLFLSIIMLFGGVNCSHITGTWNTNEFFKFLIKFGVQKTDMHYQKETLGYIFGNITMRTNFSHLAVLTALDRSYFLEYYGNRSIINKENACKNMFRKISTVTVDIPCRNETDKLNLFTFVRKVPCKKHQLCTEDQSLDYLNGYQFTFPVKDIKEPRFWYVSLVACYRNMTTCEWHHLDEEAELDYDIWLVNGNPNASSFNPLVYQFSFDRQNTILLYLVFLLCYLVLVPLQLYAVMRQHHPVTRLFTLSLLLEFIGLTFNLTDVIKYSLDGIGFHRLAIAGDILDILSRTTFMLLLLLLAKGWAVTRMELTWKPLVFTIWFVYGVVHILLYVWNMTEVDIIEDIDEYQTWPGWLILVLRCQIIVWFLLELRTTMLYEHNAKKLNFFLHFGASALVWFIYLPIIALIAMQVPAFWRFKLLLGITYSADCLAYCVMAHLLWPTRSEQYFLLAYQLDPREELDEFNEAPHVLHNSVGYTALRQASSCDSITQEFTKRPVPEITPSLSSCTSLSGLE